MFLNYCSYAMILTIIFFKVSPGAFAVMSDVFWGVGLLCPPALSLPQQDPGPGHAPARGLLTFGDITTSPGGFLAMSLEGTGLQWGLV